MPVCASLEISLLTDRVPCLVPPPTESEGHCHCHPVGPEPVAFTPDTHHGSCGEPFDLNLDRRCRAGDDAVLPARGGWSFPGPATDDCMVWSVSRAERGAADSRRLWLNPVAAIKLRQTPT